MANTVGNFEASNMQAMSKYLYGFVDPYHPGRGPTRDVNPTMLATLEGSQEFILQAFSDGWQPEFPLDPGGAVDTGEAFMINPAGEFGVMICPQVHQSYNSAPALTYEIPQFGVVPGIVFDPQMDLETVGFAPAQAHIAKPFAMWTNEFGIPTQPTADKPYTTTVPWRVVGLRSTITVTTPAMKASGDVWGCDNRDFMAVPRPQFIKPSGTTLAPADQPAIGRFWNNARSVRKLGAFSNGSTYECVWLPGSDSALNYRENNPTTAWMQSGLPGTDTYTRPYQNNTVFGNNLINSACNLFVLTGMQPQFSFRVNWVCAIEIVVSCQCSVALFLRNARLASHFIPEWAALACMNAAGNPGDAVTCLVTCGTGKMGYQMALQGNTTPGTRSLMTTSTGPGSSTAAATVKHGGTVKLLEDAAMLGAAAANAPAAWGMAQKVGKTAMNFARGAARFAYRAAPYAEEVALAI